MPPGRALVGFFSLADGRQTPSSLPCAHTPHDKHASVAKWSGAAAIPLRFFCFYSFSLVVVSMPAFWYTHPGSLCYTHTRSHDLVPSFLAVCLSTTYNSLYHRSDISDASVREREGGLGLGHGGLLK